MAGPETTTVPLELPLDEARALAQLVRRIDYGTCARLASTTTRYGTRSEGDVMWSAVCMLQRQLGEAGFDPR